jgi:hypothetical protein
MALSGVDFGHHDLQTLSHLTSFCGDFLKEESTTIAHEAWRALGKTLNRLLPALTKLLFEYLWKTL